LICGATGGDSCSASGLPDLRGLAVAAREQW
jgi:hypothetical protein